MTFKTTEWVNRRNKIEGLDDIVEIEATVPTKINVRYELDQKRTPKSKVE